MLGHKADLAFMALGPDLRELRRLQSGLQAAGLDVVDSYVSLTEVSEYAKGMPAEMLEARLHPNAAARGQAGVLLLPDDQAARGRAELVHAALRRARGADARARHVGPDVRRAGAAGDHRLDRARRLRVGRHAVRRAPRRPQGGRVHDALRPGVGHLRRVRAASTPAWSRRSRSWSPAADALQPERGARGSAAADRELALGRRSGRSSSKRNRSKVPHWGRRSVRELDAVPTRRRGRCCARRRAAPRTSGSSGTAAPPLLTSTASRRADLGRVVGPERLGGQGDEVGAVVGVGGVEVRRVGRAAARRRGTSCALLRLGGQRQALDAGDASGSAAPSAAPRSASCACRR